MDNSKYDIHEIEIENLKKEVLSNGKKSIREVQAVQGAYIKIIFTLQLIILGGIIGIFLK